MPFNLLTAGTLSLCQLECMMSLKQRQSYILKCVCFPYDIGIIGFMCCHTQVKYNQAV